MVVDNNDWLVADSEDEGAFNGLPPVNDCPATMAGNSISSDASAIQTAFFSPDRPRISPRSPSSLADESLFTPPPAKTDSTIGNFTSVPLTSDTPSMVSPKPRPRPRPRVVMKKAATSNHNPDGASTPLSRISDLPTSTRRTNESIHPATNTSLGFSEAFGDAYSSFDIAERAKMRSRKNAQQAKIPIRPQVNDVIELTSDDEDELALKPTKRQKRQGNTKPNAPTKPRPKPTLRVKPAAVMPDSSPLSEVAIQPPQVQQSFSSSQLPASTLPTIPPSTPPQARETTPPSPLVTTRKRKRGRPSIPADDDEMDIIGGTPFEVPPSLTVPPPFFAPSSSSLPTDSGIEILPVDSLSGRSKPKQPSNKKETQIKTRNKGKKGKRGEKTSIVSEAIEDAAGVSQEPSISALCHSTSGRSPVVRDSTAAMKGKATVINSCEEDELAHSSRLYTALEDNIEGQRTKENARPDDLSPSKHSPEHSLPSFHLKSHSLSNKPKLIPMSELIRRVNSQPSSPFPNATRTYSPFLKSSRTMLSRIAPLHPNRRTPPPPPPRPPPPKKSKKQLEMEERIEEQLAETVDGWSCLTDEERKALRKARIDAELGYE